MALKILCPLASYSYLLCTRCEFLRKSHCDGALDSERVLTDAIIDLEERSDGGVAGGVEEHFHLLHGDSIGRKEILLGVVLHFYRLGDNRRSVWRARRSSEVDCDHAAASPVRERERFRLVAPFLFRIRREQGVIVLASIGEGERFV